MIMLNYVAAGVALDPRGEIPRTPLDPRVVVGVSGSRSSIAALCWAAREAERRHGLLVAVLAWQPPLAAYYAVAALHHDQTKQQEAADIKLAALVREAFGNTVPSNLLPEVVKDTAEHALIARSADADLLVLGTTSRIGRSLGPVIRACLGRASCPVVIIGTEQAGPDAADWCTNSRASSARTARATAATASAR
jgi:nucleotide-binding universal stress UspA family protein